MALDIFPPLDGPWPDLPDLPPLPPVDGETDPDPDAGVTQPDGSTMPATASTPPFIGVKQMAWQSRPWQCLWLVRTDGLLVSVTYDKTEDVWAPARHPMTNGAVMSVAVIPSSTSDQDEVWVAVQRTIGGEAKIYVERMTPRIEPVSLDDKARYTFLDSSLRYSGTPETHFSGADHLEGQTCRVWADGADMGDVVIEGGAFDLDDAASEVVVGLLAGALVVSLPLERLFTERQIIGEIIVKVIETLGGQAGQLFIGQPETLLFRDTEAAMDASPPMVSGYLKVVIAATHDDDGIYVVGNDTAGPMTITAIIPSYKAA